MRRPFIVLLLLSLWQPGLSADDVPSYARVAIETTEGTFIIGLEGRRAPISVGNFLDLVKAGYYDGTIFHRVVPDFVIQGGGFDRDLDLKEPSGDIVNEAGNGLTNLRGTVVMARLKDPHSAMAQFFINVADNRSLDPKPDRWGYAVFGFVAEGMDVVDKISNVRSGPGGRFKQDVPVVPVIIKRAYRIAE
jgi:cyclophilin family peptidyl-prolyl cis-trans isomerase